IQQASGLLSEFRRDNAELRVQFQGQRDQTTQLIARLAQQEATVSSCARAREQLHQDLRDAQEVLRVTRDQLQQTQQEACRAAESAEELEQQLHKRIEEYQDALEMREQDVRRLEDALGSERDRADRAELAASQLNDQVAQ